MAYTAGTKRSSSYSESCSVPKWLRYFIPLETFPQRRACREHDAAYSRGGTKDARLRADSRFYWQLRGAGMSWFGAWSYFVAVRIFGSPYWRFNPDRWGFNGKRYCYEKSPPKIKPSRPWPSRRS